MTVEARFCIDRAAFSLDVTLSIPSRGVTALLGPSGCGKTTLLRAVAGLDRYPQAHLKVGDTLWQDERRFMPVHRRPLGYVFQESSLFEHLSVRRNIEYGLRRTARHQRSVALEEVIALLDLETLLERRPAGLSGGERQRVAMARALAVSPKLLLMDEPLASLDQERKQEILPFLESLHRTLDIPMLYVTHSLDEVARLADHLLLMERGRIKASGPVGELLTRLDLWPAHGGDAEALIEAKVVAQDDHYHLTHLDFAGGRITVPGLNLSLREAVRLRLAARDVSITLAPPSDTSILNVLPAIVSEVTEEGPAHATVRLLAGTVPLLARITRKSAEELALAPGKAVYAQVKSVALLT